MHEVCDRVVVIGMMALMAFTPLAFGTVEEWAIALMEWGIVTVLLCFALGRVWPKDRANALRIRLTGMELPLALFIGYCAMQTVPLPRPWLQTLSPGSARMYQDPEYRSIVEGMGAKADMPSLKDPLADLAPPERRPVSVAPAATWSRLRLLATLSGIFLLVAWWAETESRILVLIRWAIVMGALVSAEALIQYLTWNGRIYWFRKVPHATAFGPFVNHNHFAGFVEMIIPLGIGLIFYLLQGDLVRGSRDERDQGGKVVLAVLAVVLMVVALFFSISRAGILSSAASGCVLSLLLWRRIPSRRLKAAILVGVPVAVVLLVTWIGGETVGHHLRSFQTLHGEASYRLRVSIWEEAFRNLPGFQWTGAGLGCFEQSFAPFTPPGSQVRWDKAHNDYLQLIWETGIPGGVLFLIGCLLFARAYWWPAVRRGEGRIDVLRVGLAMSMLSIALHSWVDFNLQIGSNGFLFATLAGLLVAAHRLAMEREGSRVRADLHRSEGPELTIAALHAASYIARDPRR